MKRRSPTPTAGASLVVVGLGNIGSQFVDHAGRMSGLARVVLVDRDVYEPANLRTQKITAREVGEPKAEAQSRILRALNPALEICAIVDDVANIPPGRLRADVIVAGLDSLEARLVVNDRAWRLGVPWLDAGVEPAQQLVRINGYRPGPDRPCLECALDDVDYRNLATRHPCRPARANRPTNGSSSLGALAGALLAGECEKILAGDFARSLVGRQVVIDVAHHRHFVTSFRPNPHCRFDHAVWRLASLRGLRPTDTLADLLRVARIAVRGPAGLTLSIAGHPLAQMLHCRQCGQAVPGPHLPGRVARSCPRCQGCDLLPAGFDLIVELDARSPREVLGGTLRSVGIQPGDVVRVRRGRHECHFVISYESS
ncbi:MAG TPA: ThiF family adenylyltransferase [Opitutaceae bacterium]|nr:ThiF family adenylyltransferase [Opitutaceae bacterium]